MLRVMRLCMHIPTTAPLSSPPPISLHLSLSLRVCVASGLSRPLCTYYGADSAVSFGGANGIGGSYGSRNEALTLASMERDCFIIPAHSLERFLPAGIPVSVEVI